ncbi:hypothetical protein [uncultured Propionibacterium sp.]|uniref:hypothetical protein n=1 Tax=uncultured Propionibacterium sp. TaxID=218066 RepID=UPI002931F17D|nr:hypothetical protein [uncultured Propionibacterium sp.]
MSRRAVRRWALPGLALALALSSVACSPSGPSSAEDALAMLDSSIADGDRDRFDEALDRSIPQSTRDMWWSNLAQLDGVDFEAAADGWQVSWALPGERAAATDAVSITTGCAGGLCRITRIEPAASRPAPAWLVEAVDVLTAGGAVLLVGRGAPDLSAAAATAAAAVNDSGMPLLDADSDEPLAVEVPATGSAYALVAGRPTAETQGLGAFTRYGRGAARVVVNPDRAGQWSTAQAAVLLTHESVHWRLAGLGAPVGGNKWVSEGLAEWLGLPRDADELASSRARAVRACRGSGGASALPGDEEFSAIDDADALRGVYARSWAAVSQLVDENGAETAGQLVGRLWTTPADRVGGAAGALVRWCAANAP